MKIITSLLVGISISFSLAAQPPKGPALKGMTFGNKTSAQGAIAINDLSAQITSEVERSIKVKGKVVDVCAKEGCWLKMETADGKIMVKMKDHAFLVPVDLNGKEIVVDGTAKMKITSVKELQHYAEDAGKSKDEITAIKEPKKEIVIDANGVLVL